MKRSMNDVVHHVQISVGKVKGEVLSKYNGRDDLRCSVVLKADIWEPPTWDAVLRLIAAEAFLSAQLLNGQWPPLLTQRLQDMNLRATVQWDEWQVEHTCDEHRGTCEHAKLVHEKFKAAVAEQPMLLFQLRGMDETTFWQSLRRMRSKEHDEREQHLDQHQLEPFKQFAGNEPSQPLASLLSAHNEPPFWPKQVALYELLRPVYKQVSARAAAILKQGEGIGR